MTIENTFNQARYQATLMRQPPALVDHQQCDQKKLPNVYKSCPKMISLEKLMFLTPLQKLPKNIGDLGKLVVA